MKRRDLLKAGSLGGAAFAFGLLENRTSAQAPSPALPSIKSLSPLKITKVRTILTAPASPIRLAVVKVETSEPGLYGLGCATFNQRILTVKTAVDEYLDGFWRGRDADNLEDLWQSIYTSSYWRNGPVLNNALSGVDQALWDIKGKRAGMPVYQLLGGKTRFAVDTYSHASGRDLKELEDSVSSKIAQGFRHIRIQVGGYGSPHMSGKPDFKAAGFGHPDDTHMDSWPYLKITRKMFEHIRNKFGEDIELLHDMHERVEPIEAIKLCKDLEQYRPFFLEDPFAPEANGWFKTLRQHTSVPIAMGELFNSPHEWVDLITGRLIDFVRVHISQIGGLTPARKLASLAEWFQVRSAWHGPGDVSPVGHAANAHLDLAIRNFGIQEAVDFSPALREVFPGAPTMKNGYMQVNEAPGWGVDLNEEMAKKYPLPENSGNWLPVRRRDGSPVRP